MFTHHPAIRLAADGGKEGREREEKWFWGWWGRTCPSERVREKGDREEGGRQTVALCPLAPLTLLWLALGFQTQCCEIGDDDHVGWHPDHTGLCECE